MAIGTGDLIDKFGTQDAIHTGTPGSIATGAFSAAGDVAQWTNDDDAPIGAFVLACAWSTVTGVANKPVHLYARPMNVQSTNDPVAPSANRKGQRIATFWCYAASGSTTYYFEAFGELPNLAADQVFEFYLENQSGQTISSGWSLWVTPVAQGPAA